MDNNEEYLNNMYIYDCISGCGNKTNGSQYCSRSCMFMDYTNDFESSDEESMEMEDDEFEMTPELNNFLNIIETLDKLWVKLENRYNIKRDENWFIYKI